MDALTVTGTAEITSTLFNGVNGGTSGLTQTISTNTTLGNVLKDIEVDTTGGVVNITMPDTTSSLFQDGTIYFIRDLGNASTNQINVLPNASDGTTINNGLTRYSITEDGGSLILELQKDSWEIINRFNQKSITTVSSTSTLTEIDDVILGDTSGGQVFTTLPTAVGRRGKFVGLKKLQGNGPRWTVLPEGAETIDNQIRLRFNGPAGRGATLMSDGTNWVIIEEV